MSDQAEWRPHSTGSVWVCPLCDGARQCERKGDTAFIRCGSSKHEFGEAEWLLEGRQPHQVEVRPLHQLVEISGDTQAAIDDLKRLYGVTKSTDLLRRVLADARGIAAAQGAFDRMAGRAATPEDERIAAVADEFAKLGSDAETLGTRMVEPAPRGAKPVAARLAECLRMALACEDVDAHLWATEARAALEDFAAAPAPAPLVALSAERLAEIDAKAKEALARPLPMRYGRPFPVPARVHEFPASDLLALVAEIRSLARRLGESEHKVAGLQAGRAVLVQERDEAREHVNHGLTSAATEADRWQMAHSLSQRELEAARASRREMAEVLARVVEIAGRNEASPDIDRARLLLAEQRGGERG